jgi:protein TonB
LKAADAASATGRTGTTFVPRVVVSSPRRRDPYRSSQRPRTIAVALVVALHVVVIFLLWRIGPARNAIVAATPVIVHLVPLPEPAKPPPPEPPKPVIKVRQPPIQPPPAREQVEEIPPPPVAVEPAPTAITLPEPAPAPAVEVVAAPAAEVAPPVTPPRFDVDYLRNPSPGYPAMSRRLGEQGRVVLRVLVDPDGAPREIEVKASSGHERLDRAALETVRQWKFVPARVGKEPVAAWVLVPVSFALER